MSGADELADLESDADRLRIGNSADVTSALDELLMEKSQFLRAALLFEWVANWPRAASQLLRVIARDVDNSTELLPSVFALRAGDAESELGDIDDVIAVAFPNLAGAYRDAAVDLPGVRRRLGLDLNAPRAVPPPETEWLWPIGVAFPSVDTVEGVQARLNYLGLGAGPITGEWNELTERAFTRWQVLNGFPPTGELERSLNCFRRASTSIIRNSGPQGLGSAAYHHASRFMSMVIPGSRLSGISRP